MSSRLLSIAHPPIYPCIYPTAPLHSFERSYQRLLEVERTNEANKAKMIQDCIRSGDKPEILKHNFYTNKFDTTGTVLSVAT
jgi:hypothetical protein